MNGVGVRIHRDHNEETIYLSTRRSGARGAEIASLKKELHIKESQVSMILAKIQGIIVKAQAIDNGKIELGKLDDLFAEQSQLIEKSGALANEILALAEKIVSEALLENYGPEETPRILDCLSDKQVRMCVTAIELGEEPKDFFQSRATPPNASTTSKPEGSA